jgi:cytochrome c553
MMFDQKITGVSVKRTSAIVAALALGLLASQVSLAADKAKGEAKANEVCAACHGKDGKTPIDPSYPILAGQHEDFLLRALQDYKIEARKNAVMGAQAKGLSKADMKNLAAYYASLPSGLSHKR